MRDKPDTTIEMDTREKKVNVNLVRQIIKQERKREIVNEFGVTKTEQDLIDSAAAERNRNTQKVNMAEVDKALGKANVSRSQRR